MSEYTIHMTHIVDVPDGAFDIDEIVDDPDYFINIFEVESSCDSCREGGKMSKYTVNIEYTIDVPDDEFEENDDPIEEIEDDYNYFVDAFQTESCCVSVERC